jgi:hypothetical protein
MAPLIVWRRHVIWSRPLLGQFQSGLPGASLGDNVAFVWNVWWIRFAIHQSQPLLFSPLLQFPFGADLTLHMHTALPALLVAGVSSPLLA